MRGFFKWNSFLRRHKKEFYPTITKKNIKNYVETEDMTKSCGKGVSTVKMTRVCVGCFAQNE